MLTVLFWLALSTLISEDLACVTAGILISHGTIGFIPGVAACVFGIFLESISDLARL